MPKGRKPSVRWWNRQGGGFYMTLGGRKIPLVVPCEDDSAQQGPNYLRALQEMHKHLRQDTGKGTDGFAVSALVNRWRQMLQDDERTGTLKVATHMLAPFVAKYPTMAVRDLKAYHVREWLQEAKTWGPGTRKTAVAWLNAALNWGVREGLIESNPVRHKLPVLKARARGRESRLSAELAALLVAQGDGPFCALVRIWEGTGCRPEEAEVATAADFRGGCIVFPWQGSPSGYVHKQAKRGRQADRVIHLTPALQELVAEAAKQHPTGPLFRTARGKPWTNASRKGHWDTLLLRPAVQAHLKAHGPKRSALVPYCFRHTWISSFIDAGGSIKLCADLVGTSVAMIEKHYGHPDQINLDGVYQRFMASR